MRKGTDVIGKSIIAFDTGKRVAQVQDLIFDQDSNLLLGFLVEEAGWFHSAKVVPLNAVKAIGADALIIPSQDRIISAREDSRIERVLARNIVLRGTRIFTTDGRNLGSVVDLFFDEQLGNIEGYEASGGLFADAYSGRSFIPSPQTIKIGREVTFVPPETADLMEEQVGGLRGAMQTASTRIQESTEVAGQKLQTATEAANGKFQEIAAGTNSGFENGTRTATATVTNRLVDPDEQFAHVVGETVDRDIFTNDGKLLIAKDQVVTIAIAEQARLLGDLDQLYIATGGSLTSPINRQLQSTQEKAANGLHPIAESASRTFSTVTSRLGIDQAKGLRATRMVRSESGAIVVAPSQIVTDIVVERAKAAHREADLLAAVGLQPNEAVQSMASTSLNHAGVQLREEAAIARSNAQVLWQEVRGKFAEYQGRSAKAIHRKRIEQALGRPVTRVILDPKDDVILNVGELVTHQAIRQAEAGGVLNILLSSVYTKDPTISEAELRAPERGMAALPLE